MPNGKRLLIAYAHPDDESFGNGGLIAKYVAEGVAVSLICATDGAVGTVEQKYIEQYGSVEAVRAAELQCAAETLGFSEVVQLGYKDSGMMGSADNDNPDCLWYRYQQDPHAVTRQVVEVIRRIQPQVVLTFNKYGAYGHPDHIAIQRAAEAAFHLAADPAYDTGQAPYAPQKLYYSNIPAAIVRLGIWLSRLRGQDPRALGVNKDIDLLAVYENIEPNHTRVDIRDYYDAWDRASACHASQGGGGFSSIPKALRRYLTPYQHFTRVVPRPARDRIDEEDLFSGVTLDEPTPKATP